MLHFTADLTQAQTPGAFGWDNTPSVVPAVDGARRTRAPRRTCSSPSTTTTRGHGGDGVNRIADARPERHQVEPTRVQRPVGDEGGPDNRGATPDPDYISSIRTRSASGASTRRRSTRRPRRPGQQRRRQAVPLGPEHEHAVTEVVTLTPESGRRTHRRSSGRMDGVCDQLCDPKCGRPHAARFPAVTTISPLSPNIFVGSTRQFSATGHYSDGSTRDLTSTAAWTSSKTSVATSRLQAVWQLGSRKDSPPSKQRAERFSASTTLTVGAVTLQSITITPPTATISMERTQQFSATGKLQQRQNQ